MPSDLYSIYISFQKHISFLQKKKKDDRFKNYNKISDTFFFVFVFFLQYIHEALEESSGSVKPWLEFDALQ